jgi:hypothetical protein
MQALTDQGWIKYYECTVCSGKKQYWSNKKYPGYEIRVRPRRNVFSLYNKNLIIAGPCWLYQMEATLKQFNLC